MFSFVASGVAHVAWRRPASNRCRRCCIAPTCRFVQLCGLSIRSRVRMNLPGELSYDINPKSRSKKSGFIDKDLIWSSAEA